MSYISHIPKMYDKDSLFRQLTILPKYDENTCNESQPQRLLSLSDMYKVYIPSQMALEIYTKIYIALYRSLEKKDTKEAVVQRYENYKIINRQPSNGILGGADSFTIIGPSGIGKSCTIEKIISIVTQDKIIVDDNGMKIIPCLVVQCPFDSSVKGLLLEILRRVDETIGTKYYSHVLKGNRATTDIIMGTISTIAINHIGVLIIDEIQNVVNSKNGKKLIGSLTQLINCSGISICMIGTPESEKFFEQAMHLARRSIGLRFTGLEYDDYFYDVCESLFSYQYTKTHIKINDEIIQWLYQHSNGIISVVVSLIHDAQEIAINNETEILNIESLNLAYKKRLSLLYDYVSGDNIKKKTKRKKMKNNIEVIKENNSAKEFSIAELIKQAKEQNINTLDLLNEYISITEVEV